ncbi:MAG: 6-phosphogluconolactonase [Caulobacterales bacterium]|nr:6-phosphogluconolactonase [Caulobacterales bacterium]
MILEALPSSSAVAQAAADVFAQVVAAKPDAVVCLPTGATPEPLYAELVERIRGGRLDVSRVRWIQLDEWLGLPAGHPATCATWLEHRFFHSLTPAAGRRLDIASDPGCAQAEALRLASALKAWGGLDLAILGLGANGHLGLNEPAAALSREVHVEILSESSRRHGMLAGVATPPISGITLGMADLLQAHLVLLLVTGEGKRTVLDRLLTSPVTTALPASLLHLHANCRLLTDQAAGPARHP